MNRSQKNKSNQKGRINTEPNRQAPGRHRQNPRTTINDKSISSQVAGVHPTDNLRKYPDEAYGDTEIPHRGGQLERIKKESK
jgi:hypothetical protein